MIKTDEIGISVCSLAFPSLPCAKTSQAAVFSSLGATGCLKTMPVPGLLCSLKDCGAGGAAAVGGGAGKDRPLFALSAPPTCSGPPRGLSGLLAPGFQLVWPVGGRHQQKMQEEGQKVSGYSQDFSLWGLGGS